MLELMLRMVVMGAFATAAALLFERALAHLGRGSRHAWTFALLATVLLPLLPQLIRSPVPSVVPQMATPAIVVTASSSLASSFAFDIALLVWLSLSALVTGFYLVAYVRLRRARRTWRAAQLVTHDVYISSSFGPAIFGFLKPRIVVPEWVQTASQEEQQLILLHEGQHIEAFDHLQVLLTIAATVVQPWNPFVWLQARQLRFRLETDCDQRVLHAVPDAARYANLLVDVGSRQNGLLLMPALAEHRNGLERRLEILASRLIANRWKAAGLVIAGALVTFAACESRLPSDPQQGEPQPSKIPSSEQLRRSGNAGAPPEGPNVGDLIARNYPPLLRSAGIGGVVRVSAQIHPDGKVDGYKVVASSGHEALDQAGLKVVQGMRLLPRRVPRGQIVNTVTEEFAIVFDPKPSGTKTPLLRTPDTAFVLPVEFGEQPRSTPYDTKPELKNRAEVLRALARNYPPALRDAGIGGSSIVWILLDEAGMVMRSMIKDGSGRAELDQAALRVAEVMAFTPAEHQGKRVPVWIALPIVFTTR